MQPLHDDLRNPVLKTIVFRTQPWRQATLTQPLQCHLQRLSCKNYAQKRQKWQLHNRISTPKQKNDDFEAVLKEFEKGQMQPLHYDRWNPAAKDNSITRAAVASSNLDAAMTIIVATVRLQTRISRRTWQHKTTTITQPLHCDLQPERQETQRTTRTWTTTHCRTQKGTDPDRFERSRTRRAPAAHTRHLSSPAAATLHGKTRGFALRLPAQLKPHATSMQPLHCALLMVLWCKLAHHLSLTI